MSKMMIKPNLALVVLNPETDDKKLGTEIAQIFADIGGVELELPKRSMARPSPNFMDEKELTRLRRIGETAHYEEDPFNLGIADDQAMMVVQDFLPAPEDLILKEPETEKITIALNKDTLTFFR